VSRAPALVTPTMRRALSDPHLLGNVLKGESWQAWRAMLIALMGEALEPDERAIFIRLTGRSSEPLERIEEFWGLMGRRGGKSLAMSTLIVFLACFVDYRSALAAGERPVVLCLAQNGKQAGVVFGYVRGIIEANPMLAGLVRNRTAETLELSSGVAIEVRAASFRGIRGVTCVAAVCDEICFWYSDESGSANPDSAILDALRPSLATTHGPLIAISSPYSRRGEAFETWRRHFGEKGDKLILVAQGSSRDFNPSLAQKIVDRAMERDPAAASAEYGAQWRSDLQAFVSLEAVEACVSSGEYERRPLSSEHYTAFTDPSGGSSDSFTLALAHRERDGRIVLDAVRERQPPFSPEAVVSEFAATLRAYRCASVTGDKYAGEFPRELFRKCGVTYTPAERSKSELYVELLPLINSRRVDLLDDRKAIAQLVGLERRTSRVGKDSIDHAPGAHDDRINSIAGAVVTAAAYSPMVISDEVLEYARQMPHRHNIFY
jgi:hypothetical protein